MEAGDPLARVEGEAQLQQGVELPVQLLHLLAAAPGEVSQLFVKRP